MTSSTKTRTTLVVDAGNPLPPAGEELGALRAQHEQEEQATAALLDQLHQAHRGLSSLAKRLKTAETRHEGEVVRSATLLAQAKAAAEAEAADAQAERDRLAAGVDQIALAVRGLAQAAAAVADPLVPLVEGDDAGAWDARREVVARAAERQASAGDTAAVGQAVGAVKELVDAIAGRAKVQSNRVQLLRAHVDELQAEAAAREQEAAELKTTISAAQADIQKTRGELDETRRTCSTLGEDLDQHRLKLQRTTTSSLEKEASLLREREQLEKDLAAARSRADDAQAKVRDLNGLLRKAERCGADLSRVVVDIADADLEAARSERLPALAPARDEIADLSRDAANSMDDEIDGLFRQDLGEDLVAAARAAAEGVAARRRALAEQADAAEAKAAQLATEVAAKVADLERAAERARADGAERERLEAQLAATRSELEERTRELAERGREATALKADIAKGASQLADLGNRLEQAKAVRADLEKTQAELVGVRKDLEGVNARSAQLAQLQSQLARQLVELAAAADGSLAIAGLKAEGSVSRLTRTVTRLEGESGKSDAVATAKAAIEVADKLTGRLTQMGAELTRRGEAIIASERARDEAARKLVETQRAVQGKDDQIAKLNEEIADLQQAAKRGAAAAERLAVREQELAAAQSELARLKDQVRQATAAVEELRARSEDTTASQAREISDLRRRYADEQKARRTAETTAAERAEQGEAQLAVLRAKAEQLVAAVEEREERLLAARGFQDEAAEARARGSELQSRVDALTRELASANDRARRLETESEARPAGASAEDLSAARAERDALAAKLRTLERRHADEAASAASLKAQLDGVRRKLEERDVAHRTELGQLQERYDAAADEARRLKEKLAGLQAKVKTLTSL